MPVLKKLKRIVSTLYDGQLSPLRDDVPNEADRGRLLVWLKLLGRWAIDAVMFMLLCIPLWFTPPRHHPAILAYIPYSWRGDPPLEAPEKPPQHLLETAMIASCKVAYLAGIAPGRVDSLRVQQLQKEVAEHTDSNGGGKGAPNLAGALGEEFSVSDGVAAVWDRERFREAWALAMRGYEDLAASVTEDDTTGALACVGTHGDVVVAAFCGSMSPIDWAIDCVVQKWTSPERVAGPNSTCHLGFLAQYLGVVRGVRRAIARELSRAPNAKTLLVTGHSLGGGIAQMAAAELAGMREAQGVQVTLVTFGSPRAGNLRFARAVSEAVQGRAFRVINDYDIIPTLPPMCFNYAHNPGRVLRIRPGGGSEWAKSHEHEWLGDTARRLWGALQLRLGVYEHMPWRYFLAVQRVLYEERKEM